MILYKAKTAAAWSLVYASSLLLGERRAEAFASLASPTEASPKTEPGGVPSSSAPTPDAFDTFMEMRTGLGTGGGASDRVFWTGEGALFHSPSGRVLARFEGVDVCRAVRLGPGRVRQLSRKVFWFLDPATGERMTEYEGKPVRPIKYDAQAFEFTRGEAAAADDDGDGDGDDSLTTILTSVVRGPRIVPVQPCTPRWGSPDRTQMMYNFPIFIDMDIPGRGRYQAYEFYDYTVEPSFPSDRPPSVVWSRQGSIQPFATDGKGVMHSVGRRVTSFDDLPESIRTVIEEEYPLFSRPPADIAEVDRFQEMERKHL
mmetsp:Transcript_51285/g.154108  ORF Transcript_51285/g.154108 Transcript_51285/m.154108 type:complete len:314 (-) Transcript_51285:43-984(-)